MKFKSMKNKKTIVNSIASMALTGLWLACPTSLFAQGSELSVSVGGAASSLNYDGVGADIKDGIGFNAGLDYAYYFSQNFGIATGAEYQRMSAEFDGKGTLSGAYDAVDYEQEAFQFRYNMGQVKEEQKVGFINIPLVFVYRDSKNSFYIRAGAKVGLPVTSKFSGTRNLTTSGYYPQYNGELFDPEFMGFGSFGKVSTSGSSIDLKPSYMATLELGIIEEIGGNNFYAGFYCDYGLNNIAGDKSHPVEYTVQQSGAGFKYNSILNSDFTDDVKTLSFGVKLRYCLFKF
jgi:Outer membrane protein beta-barrel domain